jgi:ATP-dependent 26S proteasome regulatory subunit
MNLMRGIDLAKIAEKLPGASGAEIKAVCTEAGMYALRERRVHVTQEDFEMAVAKVLIIPALDPESKSDNFHRSWPKTTRRTCP